MNTNLVGPIPTDIRDIKPPVDIPDPWLWLWVLLSGLAAAILVLIIVGLFRRKKAIEIEAVVIPPHVRAKQRLAEALRLIGDPNQFCTEVSQTLRLYLEERFTLRAPERTTEEFLVELQNSKHLTLDQKLSLGDFLQSCDLVKFARHEPTETTLRQLHDSALRLVDETQFEPINTASPVVSGTTPPPIPPPVDPEAANRKS